MHGLDGTAQACFRAYGGAMKCSNSKTQSGSTDIKSRATLAPRSSRSSHRHNARYYRPVPGNACVPCLSCGNNAFPRTDCVINPADRNQCQCHDGFGDNGAGQCVRQTQVCQACPYNLVAIVKCVTQPGDLGQCRCPQGQELRVGAGCFPVTKTQVYPVPTGLTQVLPVAPPHPYIPWPVSQTQVYPPSPAPRPVAGTSIVYVPSIGRTNIIGPTCQSGSEDNDDDDDCSKSSSGSRSGSSDRESLLLPVSGTTTTTTTDHSSTMTLVLWMLMTMMMGLAM